MLKRLWLALLALLVTTGFAIAQVDVNKADQIALDGIKGLGPKTSKAVLDERRKGDFKDWADFESRVKGIGPKSGVKLSEAGLTVNGEARPANVAPAKAAAKQKAQTAKAVATADAGAARKTMQNK